MKTLFLLALATLSTANLIGFDLGSTFFKITIVQPGSPFSIVENLTSKRKTDTILAIGSETRLFSSDAVTNAGRFPKTTFQNVANYLAQDYDDELVKQLREQNFVMNEFVRDERGLIAFQTFSIEKKDENVVYYSEEILGMILKYGKQLAEKQANGSSVVDCVITVPSYFGLEQRLMLLDAAELAGLKVIQLVHENVAAATMYAIDRLDTEPLTVMLYNMGGQDTEVTIARYSAIKDDKNKEFEHVEILAESFDTSLGGQHFDKVLFDILVDRFNNLPERKGKADVRTNVRAIKRLEKEAIKIKDVLSANRVAEVKVPELLDYVTLKTMIERAEFEEKAKHLLDKVGAPVAQALALAGLSNSDI
jgi:hypoxia up-regulated 1